MPRDADLSKYSVLAICGGDGTVHEAINGMLARPDKLKLPVALLPNGSGNDLCYSLGIQSMDHALDILIRGIAIPIDTVRILLDHESEDTLPSGDERAKFCRHMDINCTLSMPARIGHRAIPYKTCCGPNSYVISTLLEAMKCNIPRDQFEITIDG